MISGLAVGLGTWAVGRTLGRVLADPTSELEVIVATALIDPEEEIDRLMNAGERTEASRQRPEYRESLDEAIALLLGAPPPRAALVSIPPGLRDGVIERLLEAAIPTYVEKPAGLRTSDLMSWIATARDSGFPVAVGTQRRYEQTYRYLQREVKRIREADGIRQIRCTMRHGEGVEGWRRDPRLSDGGGVVADAGYHVLDQVALMLSTDGGRSALGKVHRGAIVSDIALTAGTVTRVESWATGTVEIGDGIMLGLDFSTQFPQGSICEELIVLSNSGECVQLRRSQAKRTTEPARLTHQRSDGSVVAASDGLIVDGVALPGATPAEDAPLRDFLTQVSPRRQPPERHDIACSLDTYVATTSLIADVYETMNWSHLDQAG